MRRRDLAYLAGIIDGEGSVGLYWRLTRDHQRRYVTPTLQVTNTDTRLTTWLKDTLGGNVYRQRETRPTRKPAWHWSLAGAKARRVIRHVRPYLKLKAAQADVVLSIHPRATGRDSLGRIKATLTDADHAARWAAVQEIRRLNQRGVLSPPQ